MIAIVAVVLPVSIWFSVASGSVIPVLCGVATLAWMWQTSPGYKKVQLKQAQRDAQRKEDLHFAAVARDHIAQHGEPAYRAYVAAQSPVVQQRYAQAEKFI